MCLSSQSSSKNKYSTMRSHDFLNEDWQKVNKQDNTDGMSDKAVKAYRKENPGSKLKTAVTKKPSELKAGSKDAKRRKSFCSRMSGMKKAHASAETKRDPDSPINKALRRWNCEDVEYLEQALAEATFGTEPKRPARPGSRPARGHTESHRYSTGPVEAHGYAYNKRDQRIMFTKDFNSEQEAKEWARRNRATIIEINPKAQETNLPEISKPTLGRYIKAAGKDIEQRASSQSFKSGQAGDKYNKADVTHQDIRREKGIDRALSKLTREQQGMEEALTVQSDDRYKPVGNYKNYSIHVTRKPFVNKSTGDKFFIGVAQVGNNEFKEKGTSPDDALNNIKNKIDDLLNAATKVSAGTTLDFNVKFATDILSNPREEFFAKVDNIDGQPKLIIAGDELLTFGRELAQLGFKPSALRVDPQTEKGIPLPSISYSKNQIANTGLIANGRYEIGVMTVDKYGNKIFDLTYHSTVHTKSDKIRLNKPALTVGTTRVAEECAGVGIVTKQNSTADVGPGTIGKNLKAFNLAQEGHDDDEYVQQLATEFIRRAKLGRRYTPAETILGMLDRFFKKFAVNGRYFDDVFHCVVRTTDHEAGILEMETDLEEWKASRQLCRSSTPDSELGASALASCKSQGLRARDGNKSHKVGNKRITVGGHRIKGKKYGGPLPDYGTRK